jgi:hypothetical protein
MSMNNEQKRVEEGQQMTTEEKNAILRGAARTKGSTVNQNMTEAEITLGYPSLLIGEFVGTSDDITSKSGFFVSLFECKRS